MGSMRGKETGEILSAREVLSRSEASERESRGFYLGIIFFGCFGGRDGRDLGSGFE